MPESPSELPRPTRSLTPPASAREVVKRLRDSSSPVSISSVPPPPRAVAAPSAGAVKIQPTEFINRFPPERDMLLCPLGLMFPLRVLRNPTEWITDPETNQQITVKLPPQNFWVGRNGRILHIIQGGVRGDGPDPVGIVDGVPFPSPGDPWGIPGHSFPLAMTIYLVTECKSPRDTLTRGNVVRLGQNLAEAARRVGYVANFRGAGERPQMLLRRLYQYLEAQHRVIICQDRDAAWFLYTQFKAASYAPPAGEIAPWMRERHREMPADSRLGSKMGAYLEGTGWDGPDEDSTLGIQNDYNIWKPSELGREWGGGADGIYVELTPQFRERFVDNHAVPLVPEIVSMLIRNAQYLAIYVWWTQALDAMLRSGDAQRSVAVSQIQDQLGQNGAIGPEMARLHQRPAATIKAIRAVAKVWNDYAIRIGRPECCLKFDFDLPKGQTGAKMLLWPTERLLERPIGRPLK